jgi:GT2 family glycosyltransferase
MTVECSSRDGRSLLDPEHHLTALEALAGQALRERKFARAFALADRRCRIRPIAEASHFLTRAAALTHLGDRDLAYRDVRRALEIEPENIIANRSLLASPSREERNGAARTLVRLDKRPFVLKEALAALDAPRLAGVGALKAGHGGMVGWLAWKGRAPLTLRLRWQGGERMIQVVADSAHALAGSFGSAAEWSCEWPDGADYVEVLPLPDDFLLLDSLLLRPQAEPNAPIRAPDASRMRTNRAARKVAIVLPVYDDHDATRLCLETLLGDTSSIEREIIAVDDASPDPCISRLLATAAARRSIRLLRHDRNVGFARSVNHALGQLVDEDALLLNADTELPPGFLERLARAAYSADDIGTVTPFSNNGEYTSFPVPFRENELPTHADIVTIDRAAAKVNAGRVVDMPNGTGFCMYITRACLDRVGPLSASFGRGYFEDVDFCLRADAAGLRNVCAADVFVGHAGSRSFKAGKRALVVRNLETINERFPGYRAASAAFMSADPLRASREAIERSMLKDMASGCLLVVGDGTDVDSVEERTRALLERHGRVMVATASLNGRRLIVRLRDAADGIPQSMLIDCALDDAEQKLDRDLALLAITRAEFCDLVSTPAAVLRAVRGRNIPYDLYVRDAGFMCALRASDATFTASCSMCRGDCPCGKVESVFACEESRGAGNAGRTIWLATLSAAERIVAGSDEVAAMISACFGEAGLPIVVVQPTEDADIAVATTKSARNSPCLGIVVTDRRATHFTFLMELLRQVATPEHANVVVFGSTFDDLRAMAAGNVFVTGRAEPIELPTLFRHHGASHVFFPDRRGAQASPHWRAAKQYGLPMACFDWSASTAIAQRNGHLAFPPTATTGATARALRQWMFEPRDVAHG